MVQKTFGIYNDDLRNCRLFIEAGSQHIACWCKDMQNNNAKAFELFWFNATNGDTFENVLYEVKLYSELMKGEFEETHIIWDEEEVLCMPLEFFHEDTPSDHLDMIFGNWQDTVVHTQQIEDIVVLSRIEKTKDSAFNHYFPGADHVHKFYVLLKSNANKVEGSVMHIVFYGDHFLLLAERDGFLQIIRSISYQTPEDVLYTILDVCGQYNMPVHGTKIFISGMIDKQSNIYKTLHDYVESLETESNGAHTLAADGFREYPAHFFTPFTQYNV